MAFKAMVDSSARDKIKELLRTVASRKGSFYLAMLVQTSPELPDRWNLVVSAPWIDLSGARSAVSYLSSRLVEYLDKSSLAAIDRISAIPSKEPLVANVWRSAQLALGEPEIHMRNWQIGDWFTPEGYVFVSDPKPRAHATAHRLQKQRA